MQEKLIISSTLNKTFYVLIRISAVIFPILAVLLFITANHEAWQDEPRYALYSSIYGGMPHRPSLAEYSEFWLALCCIATSIFFVVLNVLARKAEITVTNVRVYGKTAFGKQVDLPIDSISAIATNILKGIAITSASGSILFYFLKDRDGVYHAINKLLIERQEKKSSSIIAPSISHADELKKYKDLLDNGIITQEEYDAKKKQLLGL